MLLFLAVIYFVIYAKFYCHFPLSAKLPIFQQELSKRGVVFAWKTLPIKCMHVLFGVAFCCCPLFFHRFLSFSNAFLVLAGVWLIKANAPRAVETELPAITFPPNGGRRKSGGCYVGFELVSIPLVAWHAAHNKSGHT